MKLLSAEQIRNWDAQTVQEQNITYTELMERAAQACTAWLLQTIPANKTFNIFCGKGYNGGDGLAIARQLTAAGKKAEVYIIEEGKKGTDSFQENLTRLHSFTKRIHFIQNTASFPSITNDDVIIDCLFGTGLNRMPEGLTADLIHHLNPSDAFTIAVDIPSGMFIDKTSIGSAVVDADVTLSFQATKLPFLIADNARHFGKVIVLDIGLSETFLRKAHADFETIDQSLVRSVFRPRHAFSHKGHHGHALLIAGSPAKSGAAILAAKACLRSGVGLLTCCVPREQFAVMNIALPEAMTIDAEQLKDLSAYTVMGIGPGMGQSAAAENLLSIVFENDIPVVADADALNILSKDQKKLTMLPAGSIITPHPKEFDRLFGTSANAFERIEKAIRFSAEHDITVVLKDHHSLVAHKGRGWFNTTGNAGLAKGGSGDVLTGIITALVAQGYPSVHAAVLGVYLHGSAADVALQTQSKESMLASDVTECLGAVLRSWEELLQKP